MKSTKNVASFKNKNIFSEAFLRLVCMLIFAISVCKMLPVSTGNIAKMILIIIPVYILNESLFVLKNKIGRIGRIIPVIIPGLIFAGTAIYMFGIADTDEILTQFNVIINNYIQEWNHFHENTKLVVCSNGYNVEKALCLVLLFCMFFIMWIVRLLRRNFIFSIMPFAIMTASIFVDYLPDGEGVLWAFAGVFICNAGSFVNNNAVSEKVMKKAVSFFWTITCLFVASICVVTSYAPVPSDDEMDEYLYNIKDIFDGDADNTGIITDGGVSNVRPRYREKPVMKITLDKKPKANIYLKGFHGNQYMNKNREFTNEYIPDVYTYCVKNSYAYKDIKEKVASYSYYTFNRNYMINKEMTGNIQDISCNIKYMSPMSGGLCLPYYISVANNNKNVVYDSDILYRVKNKAEPIDEVTNINMWDIAGNVDDWALKTDINAVKLWEDIYKEYVETYNSVDRMICFSDEMNEYVMELGWKLSDNKEINKLDNKINKLEFEFGGSESEIEERQKKLRKLELEKTIKAAGIVRKWLAENMTYSLKLDEIDENTDPIEYFVMKSKKGYCVHYAGAAVEILRNGFKVPVRYATGYIARADSFEEKDGMYVATVLDSSAHAWPEIFLVGIGWVPYEVTGGFYSEETLTEESAEQKASPTPASASSSITEMSTEATSPVKTPVPTDAFSLLQPEQSSTSFSISNLFSKFGDISRLDLIKAVVFLFVICGFIFVTFIILYICRKRRVLNELIRKRRTLHAINMINRRLYRKLRVKGSVAWQNIDDKEYEVLLKKKFSAVSESDWEHYMKIAKAAVFSNRVISVEEMEFCYEIYKKCR